MSVMRDILLAAGSGDPPAFSKKMNRSAAEEAFDAR